MGPTTKNRWLVFGLTHRGLSGWTPIAHGEVVLTVEIAFPANGFEKGVLVRPYRRL
jgi:hypothetical protein